MKRKGFLYERICSMPNLLLASYNAGKGKRKRDEVVKFEADLDANLLQLQQELQSRTYATSKYDVFIKHEPKGGKSINYPFATVSYNGQFCRF